MYQATGKLIYDPRTEVSRFDAWWLALEVNDSIAHYYRHRVDATLGVKLNRPLWRAHVTVIRGERPARFREALWKKYHGYSVQIAYSPDIQLSPKYAWLPVKSQELEDIREELGLPRQPRVPFHLTVGNTKNRAQSAAAAAPPFRVFPWEDAAIVDKLWRKPAARPTHGR